jgi:hypothetical protein
VNGGSGQLRPLLSRCLVQIDGPEQTGSGFFVAPGRIITCAHVVGEPAGQRVHGSWGDLRWHGTVEYVSPAGAGAVDDPWPLPDLAVIRLAAPPPHPCVRLASRGPTEGGSMVAVGRSLEYNKYVDLSLELTYQGPIRLDKGRALLRLLGDRLGPGMSGGPVLDLQTGEVCGVLKTARADREGAAVPVGLLGAALPAELRRALWRDHDRYHSEHPEWAQAQQELYPAGPGWPPPWAGAMPPWAGPVPPLLCPPDEVELLGLLARLPEPVDPAWLRDQCLPGRLAAELEPVRDCRDALLWLADRPHEPGRLHPIYAAAEVLAETAPPELASLLQEWVVAAVARRYGSRQPLRDWRTARASHRLLRAPDDPESVIARIGPDNPDDPRAYELTIWLYRSGGDMVKFYQEPEFRPLEDVWADLREQLENALGELPGPLVLVELVLPPELFDTAADEWQLFRRSFVKLGYRHPVVVRDLERFDSRAQRNHARPRWEALQRAADMIPIRWLHCAEPVNQEGLHTWFEHNAEYALGVPGPAAEEPGRSSLEAAILAGVPVAVWCRDRCAEHGPGSPGVQPCAGERFRQRVETSLVGRGLVELPAWIRTRRLRTRSPQDPPDPPDARDQQRDGGTVLLWDHPDRTPEGNPNLGLRQRGGF